MKNDCNKRNGIKTFCFLLIIFSISTVGCSRRQSATYNNRIQNDTITERETEDVDEADIAEDNSDTSNIDQVSDITDIEIQSMGDIFDNSNDIEENRENDETIESEHASYIGNSTYYCDFDSDRADFDEDNIDIVVGDKLYATQINDWYMYFDQYEGKTVEIEGYYIDSDPYTIIGRSGPSCPYCSGGYVSFEFFSEDDLSGLVSESDWIKVKGILRQGDDSDYGPFYYIEAISVEKMDEVGQSMVTD